MIQGEFHAKDVIFVEGKGIIGELTGFERVNKFREFTLRNEAEFIDVEGSKAYKLTAENLAQGLREIPKEMMDLGSEIVKDSTLPEATKKRLVEELQNIASTMEGGEVLQSSLRGGEGIKTRQKLLEEARQRGYNISGKDPKGLAAALIYSASKVCGHRRTQREICEISQVTQLTLRKRRTELSKYIVV